MGQEVAQNCATDHFPGAGGTHFLGAKIKINDFFSRFCFPAKKAGKPLFKKRAQLAALLSDKQVKRGLKTPF